VGVVTPMALGFSAAGCCTRRRRGWLAALLGKVGLRAVVPRGVSGITVAIGMMPRGEVGLILAGIGAGLVLDGRPVINAQTYAAAVLMVVATTLATPPLLLWALRRERGSAPQVEPPRS